MTASRCGFVPVVGRPNVGKSTLVNTLVGDKVVITSARPQTTRNTVRGILTLDEQAVQVVFVDTPGLHKPRTALGERLNRLVYASLADSDAVIFMLDANQKIGPGDRRIAERLRTAGSDVVVVVNKADSASKTEVVASLGEAAEWGFRAYVPGSARDGTGMDAVLSEVVALMPEGPMLFPDDVTTDQPERFLAGELIREKYLARLRDELPHSLAVVVGDLETRRDGTVYVPASVYVERDSQRGIVIGKGGSLLATVGREARVDLEVLFGAKVFLDLRVKVEPGWQRREALLDRLGF